MITTIKPLQGKRAAALIALVAVLAGIFQPPQPARAQVAGILFGAATLGGALDKITGAVEGIINHAAQQADKVQFAIANSLLTDLSIAKQSFQQTLDHNIDQLTDVESQTLGAIEDTLTKLEAKTFSDAEAALDHVQDVLDTIPFFNRDPQIHEVLPRYLIPSSDPNALATITLSGNFPDSAIDGYQPTLNVDGAIFKAAATTNQLAFDVPLAGLTQNAAAGAVTATVGSVRIPYHNCFFLGIFNCEHHADAEFHLGTLPASPGTISLVVNTPATRTAYQAVTTPQLNQNSADGDHINSCYHYPPDSGWSVVPGSVGIDAHSSGWAEVHNDGNCSGPAGAGWTLTTRQEHCVFGICRHGGDGNISFHMSFIETQDQNYTATTTPIVTLKWDEQRIVTIPTTATWTLTFTRFDGTVLQANQSTGFSNDFVTVSPKVGSILLSAYPFGLGYTKEQKTEINSALKKQMATNAAPQPNAVGSASGSLTDNVSVILSPITTHGPAPTPTAQPVSFFGQ